MKFLEKNAVFQALLRGLKLQWFSHIKRMDRIQILKMELELKLEGQFRRRWFSAISEDINKKTNGLVRTSTGNSGATADFLTIAHIIRKEC
jgi:hypothetical protein